MHWPIMETLCAYVRENSGSPIIDEPVRKTINPSAVAPNTDASAKEPPAFIRRGPRVDVRAALTVIGRRGRKQIDYEVSMRTSPEVVNINAYRLDLRWCDLSGFDFSGLDFSNTIFDNSTMCYISVNNTSFNNCSFVNVELQGSVFVTSRMNYTNSERAKMRDVSISYCVAENSNYFKSY